MTGRSSGPVTAGAAGVRPAAVVVLGDLGRSPRMQYHALALAARGVPVHLVGLAGRPPFPAVAEHPRITLHRLPAPRLAAPSRLPRPLYLAYAAAKALRQAAALLWVLLVGLPRTGRIVVQVPPALPTLPVALLAARATGARLAVDWHNLSHRVLQARLGAETRTVRLVRRLEGLFGRRGDVHLAVSEALRRRLDAEWGVPARVLRDLPGPPFRDGTREGAAATRRRLGVEEGELLVVSPSSWTEEDRWDLLLAAADRLEEELERRPPRRGPPAITVLLTGDGPGRRRFEVRCRGRAARWIRLAAVWLAPEDYPGALAAADLGLCLHRSASGLDLPMKLADLAGAGLPVATLDYGPTLDEAEEAGFVLRRFRSVNELTELLAGFARNGRDAPCRPRRWWLDEWAEAAADRLLPEA